MEAPLILIIDDNVEFAGLLGTLIEEQGMRAQVAHTGQDGLAHLAALRPSIVLVDLLLPDMTGHKLLEAIARAGPPPALFIVTGVFRGVQQEERVRGIVPIQGWYEKPFDTRVLVENLARLLGHTVKDRKAHRSAGEITGEFDIQILEPIEQPLLPAADTDPLDDLDIDVAEPEDDWNSITDLSQMPPKQRRVTVPTPPTPFDGLSTGFGRDHSASPAEVAAGLRTSLRAGSLATTTMPRLLNAFYVAQETGEIVFEREAERKIVYFEAGVPNYAISNQDDERLGAIARRAAGLTPGQIEEAVGIARAAEKMTGDVLVELGYVDERQRSDMLADQARSIVRSLFTWQTGRYVIGFKVRTGLHPVEFTEDTGGLVINGVRDLFELDRLRSLLPSSLRAKPSPNPPFDLYQLPLTDPEALLLLKTTGDLDVAELVELFADRLDERAVRAQIYALLTLGVLVGE